MVHNITKFGLGLLLAVILLGNAGPAFAEPAQQDNLTLLKGYCKSVAGKDSEKAAQACNSEDMMRHARNAASYHCADKSKEDGSKSSCILTNAKKYFDKAGAKTPKATTEAGFSNRVYVILSDDVATTGGSINVAEESSRGQIAPDEGGDGVSTNGIVDPAACAANPKLKGCGSDPNAYCGRNSCDLVAKYVNPAIDMLTITFGLFAIISLIMGGIQYSASNGDSQKVSNAKKRIIMTLEAIVAYAFLWGFLQFLVPGGVF